MLTPLRHGTRMGTSLVAAALLTACAREATHPRTAAPRASMPAWVSEPAPDVPVKADLAPAVYFDYRSSSPRPEAWAALEEWIAFLRVHDSLSVTLTGHTDSSGPRNENATLSKERAAAVRRALVRGGVAGQRISVRGRGEEQPQVYGKDEFAASRNRRVELEIN